MRINFNAPLLNMDGTPAIDETKDKDGAVIKSEPILLGGICINALGNELSDPQTGRPVKPIDGKEKLRRFIFGAKIHDAQKGDGVLNVPSEDVMLLKTLIADIYAVFVSGQAWQLLEPPDEEKKADE